MREVVGVSSRRLDGPRRATTQPPQIVSGVADSFKPGYLELSPEVMERLVSTEAIEKYYEVEETPFARGKYATVRRVRHLETGQKFAAKYVKKRRRSTDLRFEILHEVAVLHACADCPRIVNLHQVFETGHEMILVLELAPGGELQMVLDSDEVPSEPTVKRLMRQILCGLEYLHAINVAHLDIKPQNLVLTGDYPSCDVKLCDFGISRYIGQSADIREILGTPDYVAPEVIDFEAISLSTDMWSVGVLMYVLLTGCSPFGGDTKQETLCNISQGKLDFPQDLFEEVSEDARDLMTRLMVKKPSLRLTTSECLQHSWFQTVELPATVPLANSPSNIADVLVRTPDSVRKSIELSVSRQASIRRTPETSRKTTECVRSKPDIAPAPEPPPLPASVHVQHIQNAENVDDAVTVRKKNNSFREANNNEVKNINEYVVCKKALPSQTLPVHPTFKCKRIYIDDTTILFPVTSGQSSISSISSISSMSGGSSETSSITSDTLSEMSVDSSGDCSSVDSLDYIYKNVWDARRGGKGWIRECKGSVERALFNLEQKHDSRLYQKNSALARRPIYTSSPILHKIGNLSKNNSESRKYGVQVVKERNGNVVVLREVKAGRYTRFDEVKVESVRSRIQRLQASQ